MDTIVKKTTSVTIEVLVEQKFGVKPDLEDLRLSETAKQI